MITPTPIVSVIGPAIKTHYWIEFHAYLKKNNIPWEVVFVGPNAPDFPLPSNFRHIQADLKPAQCLEIASMEARGEFLVVFPDDIKAEKGVLDWEHYFKIRLPPFSVVGAKFGDVKRGKKHNLCHKSVLLGSEPTSPILPAYAMIRKSEWVELGGVDSQIVGSCGDSDLFMRAISRGGCPFISPNSVLYEREANIEIDPVNLLVRHRHDYYFLVNQWTDIEEGKEPVYRKKRRDPVIPFDHETIMDGNQGNLRGWIL